jgi:hypothetical protein
VGYGGLAVLSTALIPLIYPPVKWYYVLVAYIVTPLFALPNSYGTGLTDWDNCSMVSTGVRPGGGAWQSWRVHNIYRQNIIYTG